MSDAVENLKTNQRQLDADGCEVGVSRQALDETLAEVERLQAWVADLQSGLYVNCVYCGHRYGPGETTPVSMADALKAHVAACPEHPMSGLVKAAKSAADALLNADPGNPEDETGWAHDESRDAWVALRDALAKAGEPVP